MISRTDALAHIFALPQITDTETVPLQSGVGRVLAQPIVAAHTHPPSNMSAMDGYAARFEDASLGAKLSVIGEAAAGHPFGGEVAPGTCVRVFTGSVIPTGADHVIIQEDVQRDGDLITIRDDQPTPRNIRSAGIDFHAGDELIPAGTRLTARQLSICAAANLSSLAVLKQPVIALLANGDELKPPGSKLGPGEIIASNEYSLTALAEAWGAKVVNLGIAPDDPDEIRSRIQSASNVDVFVPVGGASVGDYDYMKGAFAELGFDSVFSKVAVRPGKPTWLSRSTDQIVLGLPGNPASALVCAHLFLKPLLFHALGVSETITPLRAKLAAPLTANGGRESFLRGRVSMSSNGDQEVMPAGNQDSSLLSPFVTANVLIHRAVNAPALEIGGLVECVALD